jgi:hypothetical protein
MNRKPVEKHPPGEIERRKACILNDMGSKDTTLFMIEDNPDADGSEPTIELHLESTVRQHAAAIDRVARAKGIDADLIRAIMYIEETHGWYDAPLDWIGTNKSIRPMNLNVAFWGDMFGSRSDLHDPVKNIEGGAELIRRIVRCMPEGAPIEHIATIYNNLGARKVSDYGARVKALYAAKYWNVTSPNMWRFPFPKRH